MSEEMNSIIEDIVVLIDNKNFSEEDKVSLLLSLFERMMSEDMAEYIVNSHKEREPSHIFREKSFGIPLDILYGVMYEED